MRKYISFDWAIKGILRDKANFDVLEGLLSVLLDDPTIKVNSILESETNKQSVRDKQSRLDLLAEDGKGDLYIFEIQYLREIDYFHRMLFETSKIITETLDSGEDYEKVKKVYSIHIVHFDLGVGDDYIYKGTTNFVGMNTNSLLELTDKQKQRFMAESVSNIFPTYFLLRLRNFNVEADTPLKEWIGFLKTGEIKADTEVPGLKEAKKKLDIMLLSDEERDIYEGYMYDLRRQNSVALTYRLEGMDDGIKIGIEKGLAEGIEKGLAEGIEKGAEKKNIENATKMKQLGIPTTQIALVTGLSENDIEKL